MSALHAWIDEEGYIYVSGADHRGADRNAAREASAMKTMGTIREHLGEVDPEGEWIVPTFSDAARFETLWVDPDAFDEEVWGDHQWVNVRPNSDYKYEDNKYDAMGWVPVLRVHLELDSAELLGSWAQG